MTAAAPATATAAAMSSGVEGPLELPFLWEDGVELGVEDRIAVPGVDVDETPDTDGLDVAEGVGAEPGAEGSDVTSFDEGPGVGVDVGPGEGPGVGGLSVEVGVGEGPDVGIDVDLGEGLGVGGSGVDVEEGPNVGVDVALGERLGVGVKVSLGVGLGVKVEVGVGEKSSVAVGTVALRLSSVTSPVSKG